MIYTDKLPEDCGRCSCRDIEYGLCQLQRDMKITNDKGANTIDIWAYADTSERPPNCPLALIGRWRLEGCDNCGWNIDGRYPYDCYAWKEGIQWQKDNGEVYTCSRWKPCLS